MSDNAPERIWVAPLVSHYGEPNETVIWSEGLWDLVEDGSYGEAPYILATPKALAKSDTVRALVAEARDPLLKLLLRAYDALGDDLSPSKFNKLMADIERAAIRAEVPK